MGGAAAWARRRHSGRTIVLAYHNVVPRGERAAGDRSLHLPQEDFARQLDLLTRTHDVVPLAGILATAGEGRRPRAAITFDDGYAGTVTAGVEEVTRRSLPATIFVVPGFLGGRTFWRDELADPESGEVPAPIRTQALDSLAGVHDAIIAWATREGARRRAPGPAERTATESQLADAAGRAGISLGSHTWSHPNLARLDPAASAEELERPRRWLSDRFPSAIPWLSYPYGRSSPEAQGAARHAGFSGAFLVAGGWLAREGGDPFALPRLNIPAGLSSAGFTLRVSGA